MSCQNYRPGSEWRPSSYSSSFQVVPSKGGQSNVNQPSICPSKDMGLNYGGAAGFSSKSLGFSGPGFASSNNFFANMQNDAAFNSSYSSSNTGYSHSFTNAIASTRGPSRITSVTCNEALLKPLNLEIDTTALEVKCQAKNDLQSLNSKLACFIDKVQVLEQHNILLKTKKSFLEERKCQESNMESLFDEHTSQLKKELDSLECQKTKLTNEKNALEKTVENFKKRYEEESSKRTSTKDELVLLQKDLKDAFAHKADLEAKAERQAKQVRFLKSMYEQEIAELQNCISETCVMLQVDNRRNLDMDHTINVYRSQYEKIASRSRAEAEAWFRGQYQELKTTAAKHTDDLHKAKEELQSLTQAVHKLESDIASIKTQRSKLEEKVAGAEERGEKAVKDANCKLTNLEEALRRAKHDMACQLREYQELMNIKLAMNIEIAVYKKLLEGEEWRLNEEECSVKMCWGEGDINSHSIIAVQRSEGAIVHGPEPTSSSESTDGSDEVASSTGAVSGSRTPTKRSEKSSGEVSGNSHSDTHASRHGSESPSKETASSVSRATRKKPV